MGTRKSVEHYRVYLKSESKLHRRHFSVQNYINNLTFFPFQFRQPRQVRFCFGNTLVVIIIEVLPNLKLSILQYLPYLYYC